MRKDTFSSSLMPTKMDEVFPLVAKSTQGTNNATYVSPQFAKSLPVSQLEIAQLAACLLAKPNPRMNVLDLNEGVANDAASCIIDNSAGSSQTTAFKSNAGHHAGAPELRR